MRHNNITMAWKLPAKTIHAWGSTLNLAESCNLCRAELLKTIAWEQNQKAVTYKPGPLPTNAFIDLVRVGSHLEFHETTPKHGYHTTVTDTKTIYRDCLPGKKWLKEHHKDELPEVTIEIQIDGKELSVNGNYKHGMIAGFMRQFNCPGEGKIRLVKVR